MRRLAASLVRVSLALALAHVLFRFGLKVFYFLRSPWSRDYGEGATLAMAQVWADHGSYFRSLDDYPLLVSNYPPLFIGLVRAGAALLGPTLLFPRLLSVVATLALVATLFALVRRLTGDPPHAAAVAILFLAPWFVQTWAPMARVDMLALALSLGGLLVLARGEATSRAPRRAFPLFWLAWFTKQTALVAPAAVVLDAWLARDRRTALRVTAHFLLPLAAAFGLLVLATSGEAWRHMVRYTGGVQYEWGRMAESYLQFAWIAAPLLGTIVASRLVRGSEFLRVAAQDVRAAPSGEPAGGFTRILLLYFLLGLAVLAAIAKEGAGQNYFLEPWLATVLLSGVALHRLTARRRGGRAWREALVLAAVLVASFGAPGRDRLPASIRNPAAARDMIALDRAVRDTAGDVLSENLAVLVLNRKAVLLEPFGYLTLARASRVRSDRLLLDCERGRFALVVTEHRLREIPGFSECLDRRYDAWQDLGPYQAFRPRPRTP